MVSDEQLAESKAIQRRTGPTFHLATRMFPRRIRHATYALYAFFRVADDVVDDADPRPPAVQHEELDRIRDAALGRTTADSAALRGFAAVRREHDIPETEVREFIRAMREDISPDGTSGQEGVTSPSADPVVFEDVDDRSRYLRGSAVAVANMMTTVMAPPDPERALPHARSLGEAFQLTNFLRDVREDIVDYNRIYLPRNKLRAHSVRPADIVSLECSPAFREAIRTELRTAEERYRHGVAGIRHLPTDCQFPVLLAAVYYAEYHQLIRDIDYDVIGNPPSLTKRRYAGLLARTWAHWRLTGDPVRTFARVSAVDLEVEEPNRNSYFHSRGGKPLGRRLDSLGGEDM